MRNTIEKSLRQIFAEKAKKKAIRWGCLTEVEIASFVDQETTDQERQRIESHLDRCVHCREHVAFLAKLNDLVPQQPVPAAWLARARELPKSQLRGSAIWRWGWGTAAAAVACLVLVSVITVWNPRQEPRLAPELTPGGAPSLRGGEPISSLPELTSPAPGATLGAQNLEFRWKPVEGAREYEISIVTSAGDLVWEKRTDGTSATAPPGLLPGHKYFVWIRAYMRDDKALRSGSVPFVISNP
jgi:hypothetical protein